jgi:hypothetical protein
MDSKPINQFSAPTGEDLEPPPSSLPIHEPSYELRPAVIAMVRDQFFLEQKRKIRTPTFVILRKCACVLSFVACHTKH